MSQMSARPKSQMSARVEQFSPKLSSPARDDFYRSARSPTMPGLSVDTRGLQAGGTMGRSSTQLSGQRVTSSPIEVSRPRTSNSSARSRIFTTAGAGATAAPTNNTSVGHGDTQAVIDVMHDDPEEFLFRLQKQRDRDRRRGHEAGSTTGAEAERQLNAFSRPMLSQNVPLRSAFLDPEVNNFPKSLSKTELSRKVKKINMPHPSYDIDGDGYVSQEDYFLAKRFDLDGNGILDPDEQEVGRFIMAQEFFRRHKDDAHLYGPEWTGDERQNIHQLATAHTFQRLLSKLKETEKHYRDVGSHGAQQCLTMSNKDLTKHNWYVDKFDTTAWNDFGANPRQFDPHTTDASAKSHGSRHKMYHLRKMNAREKCQSLLDQADAKQKKFSNRRISLMTNWSIENS